MRISGNKLSKLSLRSVKHLLELIYSNGISNRRTPLVLIQTLNYALEEFLINRGFSLEVPDSEERVGAATLSYITMMNLTLRDSFRVFFTQRCHRPKDARIQRLRINHYSRSSIHTQFQILSRPALDIDSIKNFVREVVSFLGLNPLKLTFHKDSWSSPIISAYGDGFEGRYNDVEIVQCTNFNVYLGRKIEPVTEIVFGLERLIYIALREKYSSSVKCVINYSYYDRLYGRITIKSSRSVFRSHLVSFFRGLRGIEHIGDLKLRWRGLTEVVHLFNLISCNVNFNVFHRIFLMKRTRNLINFF